MKTLIEKYVREFWSFLLLTLVFSAALIAVFNFSVSIINFKTEYDYVHRYKNIFWGYICVRYNDMQEGIYTADTKQVVDELFDFFQNVEAERIWLEMPSQFTGLSDNVHIVIDMSEIDITDEVAEYFEVENSRGFYISEMLFDNSINDEMYKIHAFGGYYSVSGVLKDYTAENRDSRLLIKWKYLSEGEKEHIKAAVYNTISECMYLKYTMGSDVDISGYENWITNYLVDNKIDYNPFFYIRDTGNDSEFRNKIYMIGMVLAILLSVVCCHIVVGMVVNQRRPEIILCVALGADTRMLRMIVFKEISKCIFVAFIIAIVLYMLQKCVFGMDFIHLSNLFYIVLITLAGVILLPILSTSIFMGKVRNISPADELRGL